MLVKVPVGKTVSGIFTSGQGANGLLGKAGISCSVSKGTCPLLWIQNEVIPGMWSGGIVGLKSILGLKSRAQALEIMNELSALGYISYSLDPKTKKLTYQINDWVVKCSGAECSEGTVYASDGYGFICLPRDITQRLADSNRKFSESDAWLDLWCHTVWQDSGNIFSLLAPTVQFERRKALLTLETMGQRWKWEKTKVWRFFQKYKDVFALYRLPGSYGCLIFNQLYQTGTEVSLPTQANVVRIIEEIRISAANVHIEGTDHERLSRMIAWFSVKTSAERIEKPGENSKAENRVALSSPIIRAYFSLHCWNCKNCNYDCKEVVYISPLENFENIRGPCVHFPEFKKSKESYYERE